MLLKRDARTSSKKVRSTIARRTWMAIGFLTGASVAAAVLNISYLSAQPAGLLPVFAAAEQQAPMGNRERLQRGINEFRNGQYEEALADLQQVRANELVERDRNSLTDYLSRAEQAAAQRKAARAEFEQGEQSLAGNKPTEATAHYQAAINNRFADEGTRAKSREQLAVAQAMMRQAGQSLKDLYDQAVADERAGRLQDARTKFQQLQNADYRPGLFRKSPGDYVRDLDRALATAQPAPAPVTPEPAPAPAPMPVATPNPGRDAYEIAVQQFNAGDLNGAKANFERASALNFNAGQLQDPPERYLARIAETEAQQRAAAAAAAAAQAQARAQAQQVAPPPPPAPAPVVQNPTPPAPPPPPPPPPAVVEQTPPPAPTMPPAEPRPNPRAVYQLARQQFNSGDLAAAKKNFELARDLNYRPGLFEDSPARYLTRITERQAQEAAIAQREAGAAQAALQAQPGEPAPDRAEARRRAAELVDQAETARAGGRLNDALSYYAEAADLDPDNTAAIAGRNQLRDQVRGPAGTGQPSALAAQDIVNQQQRDYITFSLRTALENARSAQSASQFDEAQAAIERARVARNINPTVFRDAEIRGFDSQIAQAQSALDEARVATRAANEEDARQQLSEQQLRDRRIRDEELRGTISDLTAEANQMITNGQYDQALGVIDQIINLSPRNEYATGVRPLVADRADIARQRLFRERFDENAIRQFTDAEEKKIPYNDILRFPDNWPSLSERRDRTVAIERGLRAEDAQAIAQLERTLPEVRFDAIGFADVIEFLRDVSGANIFVNWRALETSGIDRLAPVTARLRDVKFSKALETILRDVGGGAVRLGYTVDEGVISISTEEDLAQNVVTNVYDIQDLLMNVTDFDQPPTFNIQAGGAGGGGGGALFGNLGQQQNVGLNTRAQFVDQIILLIQETVARESWRDNGGNVGSIRELSGQLIVTQTPENQRNLTRLLDQLRETRAIQITVETRFLTVQRNFLEEIGVDFDFVLNPNGELSSRLSPITVNNNSEQYTSISSLTTSVPGNIATELVAAGSSATGVTPNFGVSGANGGAVTFLDDFQVSVLVRATQISQTSTILTAPRLTLFNGQRANVVVSTETAYVQDLTPIVGTNAVAFDPQVGVANSGVVLDVQGTVSSDRKYVTLTLRPTLQRLRSLVPFPVSAISNTPISDGSGTPTTIVQAFLQQPVLDVTSVQTTVSVPDGATLLLGGQTLAGEIERTSGVPVLSKIPFLKRLFTNQSMSKDEQVLLILVKPTIIIQREEEQRQFPLLGTRAAN